MHVACPGEDGVAAPRLRDADLPLPRLRAAYTEMVCVVRALYQKCRLVHADLSEYNILYHKVRGCAPACLTQRAGGACMADTQADRLGCWGDGGERAVGASWAAAQGAIVCVHAMRLCCPA